MFFEEQKSQKFAIILAIVSAMTPLSGWHKLYLQQYRWGLVYLLASVTLTPQAMAETWLLPYFGVAQTASLLEGIWYFLQSEEGFQQRFSKAEASGSLDSKGGEGIHPQMVSETAQAIRKLDQLREDGLLSEYEFEQQRRQLIEGIKK